MCGMAFDGPVAACNENIVVGLRVSQNTQHRRCPYRQASRSLTEVVVSISAFDSAAHSQTQRLQVTRSPYVRFVARSLLMTPQSLLCRSNGRNKRKMELLIIRAWLLLMVMILRSKSPFVPLLVGLFAMWSCRVDPIEEVLVGLLSHLPPVHGCISPSSWLF